MLNEPQGAPDVDSGPDDDENTDEVEQVAPFRIILTAACNIHDLASLPGESVEHARNDATLAISQAFHQALHNVNADEGTNLSQIDFRIEKIYVAEEFDHENHLYGGYGGTGS